MTAAWRIADASFEPELCRLERSTGVTSLEPRTAAVLLDLVEHAGALRTRDELLDSVWGDAFVGEGVLTHCVWELRKAFGDDARNARVIQTLPRRGYRLIAPVTPPSERLLRVLLYAGDGRAGERPSRRLLHFDRPVDAVRRALALRQTDRESPPRLVVHMDEISAEAPSGGEVADPDALEPPIRRLLEALLTVARPGQILLTRAAFDLARRTARDDLESLRWQAHGAYSLPGLDEAVQVFETGDEGSPLAPPASSETVRRAAGDETIVGWRPGPGVAVPQRPHWTLVEKLGEGSFGEVWLTAHRKTGERRVYKFCFEADRLRALQREVTLFRLLKEALGRRDDIVRLIDWDFDDAPYFVEMEHTAGGSLVDWAAAEGGIGAVPLAQRLELVAQAAEALAAAHSVGVLHQDVKPSNLLIHLDRDGTPRARLADFGIGRLLDRRRHDQAGVTFLGLTAVDASDTSSTAVGTRLYMAPEILEGRIASTEADVYALGVVLYQVTVGDLQRAVATGWQRAIDDALLRDDIAACVDLSPRRRPSATELADRLRTLEKRRRARDAARREREEARRAREALVTAQRRRRLWLAAAIVGAVATLVVSLAALQARAARVAAEESRHRAEELVRYMLGDLRDTLGSVGRLDAIDGTVETVLDHLGAPNLDQLADQDLAWRAEALRQVGEVRLQQGRLDEAASIFEAGAAAAEQLVARDPARRDWRAGEADSRFWLGFVAHRRGDLETAADAYEAHRARYEELVTLEPESLPWRLELAYGHHNLGDLALAERRLDEAAAQHLRSREIFALLAAERPGDAELQLKLAGSHNRLGLIEQRRGGLRAAREHYRADERILRRLLRGDPDDLRLHERLAVAETYVARAAWMLGDLDQAEASARSALESFRGLVAHDADNTDWRRRLAFAEWRLGEVLAARGAGAEALESLSRSIERLEALLAEGASAPQNVRRTLGAASLARAEARGGSSTEAVRRDLDRAREVVEALPETVSTNRRSSPDHRRAVLLASLHLAEGDLLAPTDDAARAAWTRAVEILEPLASSGASRGVAVALDAEVLDVLCRALLRLGRRGEAEPRIERLRRAGYRVPAFERAVAASRAD